MLPSTLPFRQPLYGPGTGQARPAPGAIDLIPDYNGRSGTIRLGRRPTHGEHDEVHIAVACVWLDHGVRGGCRRGWKDGPGCGEQATTARPAAGTAASLPGRWTAEQAWAWYEAAVDRRLQLRAQHGVQHDRVLVGRDVRREDHRPRTRLGRRAWASTPAASSCSTSSGSTIPRA